MAISGSEPRLEWDERRLSLIVSIHGRFERRLRRQRPIAPIR
jgi:hypothetical protein